MKHTLKSLLITSVLTLPCVFGADSVTITPQAPSADSVTSASRSITRSGITPTYSSSSGYPAAEAASNSPVTSSQFQPGQLHDELFPTTESTSTALVPAVGAAMAAAAAPRSSLLLMNIFIVKEILGFLKGSFTEHRISKPGFLGITELATLAGVNRDFNRLIQPSLSMIGRWRESFFDITSLLTEGPLTEPDTDAFIFLGADPNRLSVKSILNIAFQIKLWKLRMTDVQHNAVVNLIESNPRFTNDEKMIFRGLLPNATPEDIRNAAYVFVRLGPAYTERAAALYERSANHSEATRTNIIKAALGLHWLGKHYYGRAAALYERAANHREATPYDIRNAAKGLRQLGFEVRANALLRRLEDSQ